MTTSTESLYDLLKRRDAEIVALRELLEAMRSRFASAAADAASDSAWAKAYEDLGQLYYEHGLKSDGRFVGE